MTRCRARCFGLLAGAVLALCLTTAAEAKSRLRLEGNFVQGGLVHGKVAPGSSVRFLGRNVRVGEDGRFIIGFGRDFKRKTHIEVQQPNGYIVRREFEVKKRAYKIQRIDGLPPKMVSPGPRAMKRIRRENMEIAAVRRRNTPVAYYAEGFIWPVKGTVTGVYGSQRVLNGEPRRPHYGLDIAMPTGAPVLAPAGGVVSLAADDLYFTGGTVMLDHGHGLTSVYSHLSQVSVKAGETVGQGEQIGLVGATGRSTGAHLDWRFNWFKQRLDPELLAPQGESKAKRMKWLNLIAN